MTAAYDLIIVGEGIAGLTCAAESLALGLTVASFEAEFFGGLVVNVNDLDNFEEAGGLSGLDHASTLAASNKKAGVKSAVTTVTSVCRTNEGFEVETSLGKHAARFVVIASGVRLKNLDVPGEMQYAGRGVSHCADCDGPMYTDAEVVVAGAGDWALKNALLLSRDCATVHIVHESAELEGCTEYVVRVKENSKIRLHPCSRIEEILGDDSGMTGLRVKDQRDGTREIQATGLFVLGGMKPNGSFAPREVARDQEGYLRVNEDLETAVPGLWAIGQVRSGFKGWLHHAVADARLAAVKIKAKAG
jgi:thioredoxin reductase (NADPH)